MYTNVAERDLALIDAIKNEDYKPLFNEAMQLVDGDDLEAAGVAMFCAWALQDLFSLTLLAERAQNDRLGELVMISIVNELPFEKAAEVFLSAEEKVLEQLKKFDQAQNGSVEA